MATKKEKRARLEARAAERAEETRLSGLAAQKADKDRRARMAKIRQDAAAKENQRLENILKINGLGQALLDSKTAGRETETLYAGSSGL